MQCGALLSTRLNCDFLFVAALKINTPEDEGHGLLTLHWNPNVWGNLFCRQEFFDKCQMGCHQKMEETCWEKETCVVSGQPVRKNRHFGTTTVSAWQMQSGSYFTYTLSLQAYQGTHWEGMFLTGKAWNVAAWSRRSVSGDGQPWGHHLTDYCDAFWGIKHVSPSRTISRRLYSSYRQHGAHTRCLINVHGTNGSGWVPLYPIFLVWLQ